MPSNIRRGRVPHRATGMGEHVDEVYSLKGFFGEWAHMWRHHNLAHPLRWSDPRLMFSGLDPAGLVAPDRDDPRGAPLPLLTGDGVAVALSQRSAAMPFSEKHVDAHQIRFYHRGEFLLETELGPLEVVPGDFVVVPRGLIYRETPKAPDGNAVYVFATDAIVQLAETLWDSVGYASLHVDYTRMEVPEPRDVAPTAGEHELRVRYDGAWHSMTYGFDPCADVVGWVGDPVVFKMSVWDVPATGTDRGYLTPPSACVLLGEDRSFFFNALSVPPAPRVGPPDGSWGAPSHLNDYDELWLNHVSPNPATEGHLWLLPRTLPHPGLKRPAGPPADAPVRSMRVNFDTRAALWWTPEAQAQLFADPLVAKYESFFGVPAPDEVRGA